MTSLGGVSLNLGEIEVFDIDGDCIPDIVKNNGGGLYVRRGLGGRQFASPEITSVSGLSGDHLVVGDWNGDGAKDVVVGPMGISVNFARLLNDRSGSFGSPRVFLVNVGPESFGAGDFDENGRDELLVGSRDLFPDPLILFRTDANGDSDAGETLWDGGKQIEDIAVTDVQGDGNLDVLALESDALVILLGNGQGGFSSTSVPTPPDQNGIRIGDLNGDGFADAGLLFGDTAPEGPLSIYEGSSAGVMTATGEVHAPGALSYSLIEFADVNQDGATELLVLPQLLDWVLLHNVVPQPEDMHCQPDLASADPVHRSCPPAANRSRAAEERPCA